MSQGSAQAQDEDQHWLENCLPLVQESQPMFADSEDAFDVNSTEQDLRQSDANKLRELDGVRDRLRGNAPFVRSGLIWSDFSMFVSNSIVSTSRSLQARSTETYQRTIRKAARSQACGSRSQKVWSCEDDSRS